MSYRYHHRFRWDKRKLQRNDLIMIQKYETNDLPPPRVRRTEYLIPENESEEEEYSQGQYKFIIPTVELKPKTTDTNTTSELPSARSSKFVQDSSSDINVATQEVGSELNITGSQLKSKKKLEVQISASAFQKQDTPTKPKKKMAKNKGKSTTCMQEGPRLVWKTRGEGVCADDDTLLKKFTKPPNKMPQIMLYDFLNIWDVSSSYRRHEMLRHFLKSYVSIEPLDLDYYLSRGGTLILSRFTIGMQIAFLRRKHVWIYFQALGIFMKSLQGERFMYEFLRMGGLATAFEVLRVNEMSLRDKTNVFHFLYRLIDGQGGTRVKQFICRDSSALESVVDCLTMCKDPVLMNFARTYMENLCIGNTLVNLQMISKYVISLLTCDFNPPLQQMACQVLPHIVRQNEETARHCYTYVVDALRTDYPELLIDVGDLAIAMMATNVADDFLVALNSAAQPSSVGEDLAFLVYTASQTSTNASQPQDDDDEEEQPDLQTQRKAPAGDAILRQQYGALYVLSYMLKNRTEFADWMVEKGVIGSLLAAIGTSSNPEAQLLAIRLLLLIHELSPDCAVALTFLIPKKLLVVILEEEERCLAYLTAVMCTNLRRIGRLVQKNWFEWFDLIVLPDSPVDLNFDQLSPAIEEIVSIKELLDSLVGEELQMIVDHAPLPIPDPAFLQKRSDDSRLSPRITHMYKAPLTPGEVRILLDDDLEPFRKYIHPDSQQTQDDLEKYYADKFGDDNDYDMGGMEMARLKDAEKALAKFKDQGGDPFRILLQASESEMMEGGTEEELEQDLDASMFASLAMASEQGASGSSDQKSINPSFMLEKSIIRGSTQIEKNASEARIEKSITASSSMLKL